MMVFWFRIFIRQLRESGIRAEKKGQCVILTCAAGSQYFSFPFLSFPLYLVVDRNPIPKSPFPPLSEDRGRGTFVRPFSQKEGGRKK